MNKRIRKKKQKKIQEWVERHYDVWDGVQYKTIPVRCHSCAYFEPGDASVGAYDLCCAPRIYSEDGDIVIEYDEQMQFIMERMLGYGCTSFRR